MAINQKYPYHCIPVDETLDQLQTCSEGLSANEAAQRLQDYGPNELTGQEGTSMLFLFLKQFRDFLILILLIAAGVAWYSGQYVDVYVILGIILFNAILGFLQEYRAEKAILALKRMIKQQATVLRDNKAKEIDASELVPGDIILLEEGDGVPADARILQQKNLKTVEASLTGEVLPVSKHTELIEEKTSIGDRQNMIFRGTHVAHGTAKAIVTATGKNTEIGKISESLSQIKITETNFRKKTSKLGRQMAAIAIFTSIIVFVIGYYLRGFAFQDVLLITVATLVSSVPEGLPAVISIVLAIGANRMAKQNAIIREFTATEMLGAVTVILTDKTGTITQSILTVSRLFLGDGSSFSVTGDGYTTQGAFEQQGPQTDMATNPVLRQLLLIAEKSNNAHLEHNVNLPGEPLVSGDPTEVALLVLSKKAQALSAFILPQTETLDDLPFSSDQKYRATLIAHADNTRELLVIGAPEIILERSSRRLTQEGVQDLSQDFQEQLSQTVRTWTSEAMRVLALAYKPVPASITSANSNDVNDLVFVGITGIVDPPRSGVKEAIGSCKSAGIRVMMLTGDHKETGAAIAREVGIIEHHEQDENYPHALQENELEEDEALFEKQVQHTSVFARVSPATKMRIAEHLQDKGHLIAMTGDGVNDAPALKRADVGIAMGIRGTDVAKDASHIVLSDDNFSTIVAAVREGRIVFQNVRKTSFFLLTTNFAEVSVFIVAIAIGWPFPLTATQILWVNLVTDGIMELGLAGERGEEDIMKQKPVARDEPILDKSVIPYLLLMSITMVVLTLGAFRLYLPQGAGTARTAVFLVVAMAQVFNTYNMRSLNKSLFSIGAFSNKYLNIVFLISLAMLTLVIYSPYLRNIFRFELMPIRDLVFLILLSSIVILVAELYKFLWFRGAGKLIKTGSKV
ncbi:cation-translocating P-type ATPase [Pontibacter vulgaris]|uniref:cation-translocating P-type ATPase n=1 Tax=Pontibacter vulgaris TaxID=2905679 RepID=UPI001FA71BDA|nr:HAD-IC family P-type ATPase [Pontibacter vulgaris]